MLKAVEKNHPTPSSWLPGTTSAGGGGGEGVIAALPAHSSSRVAAQGLGGDFAHASAQTMVLVLARVEEVIWEKRQIIQTLLAALFSGGHVLLEDTPGVGKTTLAQALAIALGLNFKRVQFTSDLLPSDITGGSVYNRETTQFDFQPGPVFCELLLADEINRASPKTQSALLQAMEERKVTVDGISHSLPLPFLVIATQNPTNHSGTQALPESQLDRFVVSMGLGYPGEKAEIALLMGENPRNKLAALEPVLLPGQYELIHSHVAMVKVSAALARYVFRIAAGTRNTRLFGVGLSPRAVMGLVAAAKALALMDGRNHVLPDDIAQIYPWVAAQRLNPLNEPNIARGPASADFHRQWLKTIPSEA